MSLHIPIDSSSNSLAEEKAQKSKEAHNFPNRAITRSKLLILVDQMESVTPLLSYKLTYFRLCFIQTQATAPPSPRSMAPSSPTLLAVLRLQKLLTLTPLPLPPPTLFSLVARPFTILILIFTF